MAAIDIDLHTPFDNASQKVFTDHESALQDWQGDAATTTTIRHIAEIDLWTKEKPFCLNLPLPDGQPRSNFIGTNYDNVSVCNIRGRESQFTLDRHGFAFIKCPPFKASFDNIEEIESVYLEEMGEFLKGFLSADEVFVFDYTRRHRLPFGSSYDDRSYRPPGRVAHVDQTPDAALRRLRLHFGAKGEQRVRDRMQLINLWRPTFGPLQDCPMAVCDSRSLQENQLVASDLVYPHYVGEKYDIKWSDQHRWYYLANMGDDECLLIKNFDTCVDGRARFCAHCAFVHPETPPSARARESIEIRAMVFHHDGKSGDHTP